MTFPFALHDEVQVRIEVPRGAFAKRSATGRVEFVSPFRCPYNYGSVEGAPVAPDGEGFDALVLGATLPRGGVAEGRVLTAVDFVDRGVADPKLVVGAPGTIMAPKDRHSLSQFFRRYARIKRVLRLTRRTEFRGWLDLESR